LAVIGPFAKIDTRLPPAAAPIGRQQPRATEAAQRAFIARLEQEARERAPKPARKIARSAAATRWSRRTAQAPAKQ
jgi:hypothetical protein